ncbi:CBS domain-containing protein [Thermatribacter velox]|uniref:CBS domain-containing protein n=1 Tax=Thermatribacter velox TaxID=3039681 RepID=A0ABZ2Y8I0_9BACT
MQIVVAHEGTDFDAFASMYAVTRLFPSTQIVLGGSVNRNLRRFLSLYGQFFDFLKEKEVFWEEVKKVFVVDTSFVERVGKAGLLIKEGKVDYYIIDHHLTDDQEKRSEKELLLKRGACSTIMVELLQEQKIEINSLEATLLALGIYEDTGFFTFSTTTFQDLEAASFLLQKGALLSFIPRFTRIQLTSIQRRILKDMIDSLETREIAGCVVHFTQVKPPEYVEGVSFLVHKLMDLEEIDVLFALFAMEEKTYVIARSRIEEIDLNCVLQELGGGGHRSAASCSVKGMSFSEVRQKIEEGMQRCVRLVKAREIMSHPVKVVSPSTTVEEAFSTMMRFGFSGLPVVEDNKLVGLISRKDVEKAISHGLHNAPVKSFMNPQVISVEPEDSIFKVWQLMVEQDIGRVPVTRNGLVLGIITRSDLLRGLHQRQNLEIRSLKRVNFAEKIFTHFNREDLQYIQLISELAKRKRTRVYLVGGVVRDLILGFPNYDLDLVVEGDAIEFASFVAQKLEAKLVTYQPFGTASLFVGERKRRIDFASARQEFYAYPGAPPQVEHSNLRRDLFRRDFTINAMAISIYPDDWGELFDFFGGFKDLQKKLIRVLHPLSFVEDPARAIRAVRFEKKYGFQIEPFTMSLLKQTVREGLLAKIKPDRLKEEIQLILRLPGFYSYLQRLYQLDMFPYLFPGCVWKSDYDILYPRLERLIQEEASTERLDFFLLKMTPLLSDIQFDSLEAFVERLHLSKRFYSQVKTYLGRRTVLERILQEKTSPPSRVFEVCSEIPLEFLYFTLAKFHDQDLARERIRNYLTKWRFVKPELTGSDLKQLGIPQGPIYAKILRELQKARIDNLVYSREEEIALAIKLWERMKASDQ